MTPAATAADLRPRPLEVVCGLVINGQLHGPKLGRARSADLRAALERSVLPALRAPPCLVSFSGGRDSAAVLAIAASVARREGLALPIPATYRFPDAPATREDGWQEDVVRHLGLADWECLTMSSELDSVGPVAQSVLRRHGVLWPFNAHFHVPLFERAAGGSLLTGIGGDELLGPQRWHAAQRVLAGRVAPRPRHLRTAGLALSPVPMRRAVLARRRQLRWPWLHPDVDALINRRRADWQARTPLRWDAALARWWQSRTRSVLSQTFGLLAQDAGAQAVHPFLDRAVLRTAAARYGPRGPVDRSTAMRDLFGELLPASVLARRSKASFDEAFCSDHSRAFAARWSGSGVDRTLVDPEEVAAMWNAVQPDPRSFSLMQAAWLASEGLNDQEERI